MKRLILAASVGAALLGLAGQSFAACVANPPIVQLTGAEIVSKLGGQTVCVPSVTVNPMTWQEQHVVLTATGGSLIDFKRGPSDPVDPSEPVGNWSVNTTANTITHNYGAGGSYTYTVFGKNGAGNNIVSFCGSGPEIVAAVKAGPGC